MKHITRTIWVLSLVSLFTDMASEMLYPILPIYLKSIGFSVVLIGVLEGIAEATAGLSKGYFGKLSDSAGRRVPFVRAGYALSAISKPMMAMFVFPIWIFFARTIDRLGKGIRTGARDALLADESPAEARGKVFGFHRSMDTLGAVMGPAFALLYLYFFPDDYLTLFFIAFAPGLLAVAATFLIHDRHVREPSLKPRPSPFSFLRYWKDSPARYRKVAGGLLAFALFNSSDVFLLLMGKQAGFSDTTIIGLYIFYNLVYAILALPLGILADKIGLKKMLLIGLSIFTVVYAGMALNHNLYVLVALFFLYGVYAAATEGVSKAWISNITARKNTATAIGLFSGLQSLCAMAASSLTGLAWFYLGAQAAFFITASATTLVVAYFLVWVPGKNISVVDKS